ncbi:hypothetical protein C5E23_01035 [Pectobacterium parmentieri]|nr:hypothetical protein C5E25_01050 [Pectobacterium parmentieri]AYH12913.1 hypothetical protein C5E23_01035 [Pectobacterium parmentieri]AYH21616.1 hypothetical protein C5E21_01030 [Pectobacterium parmentieri]
MDSFLDLSLTKQHVFQIYSLQKANKIASVNAEFALLKGKNVFLVRKNRGRFDDDSLILLGGFGGSLCKLLLLL